MLLHGFGEIVEKVMGIVWAGGGLRVILHAEYGMIPMAHSFDGVVVEI